MDLFTPGRIGPLSLRNRLIRSATLDRGYWSSGGNVSSDLLKQYELLAKGGVGAIITGALLPYPQAIIGSASLRFIYPRRLPLSLRGLRKWATAVHEADPDCRILGQLNDVGRPGGWGPSAVAIPTVDGSPRKVKRLTRSQIRFVISMFASGIAWLARAGFDGAQLHAAHGYLLSSFLSPYTNRRLDEYGGSAENRVRIIREIVFRSRQLVGDFPILIKMNCDDHVQGGLGIDNFSEHASQVQDAGVDAIEISGGIPDAAIRPESENRWQTNPKTQSRIRVIKPELQSYYASHAKEFTQRRIPLILTGGNRDPDKLSSLLREGAAEFFGLSRPLLCQPDLPQVWKRGEKHERIDCITCNSCTLGEYSRQTFCVFKNDKKLHKRVQRDIAVFRRSVRAIHEEPRGVRPTPPKTQSGVSKAV